LDARDLTELAQVAANNNMLTGTTVSLGRFLTRAAMFEMTNFSNDLVPHRGDDVGLWEKGHYLKRLGRYILCPLFV